MTLNQQIEHWLDRHQENFRASDRPFVTLSYAQSWDGSIAYHPDEALPLSGPESAQLTHQIRSLHDGILVGIGTVLADDPQLTTRLYPGPNPQPIVLDSQLRMPPTAHLCHHTDKNCWVLTGLQDKRDLGNQVDVITLACDTGGRVNLLEALSLLRQKGIRRLMVEGGGTVITEFLKARLADALVITVAPMLVGGYKAVGALDGGSKVRPRISPLHSGMLGDDMIVWGDIHYDERVAP